MKRHDWSVLVITLTSLAGLVIIITGYDPYTAGKLVKFLFFGSLALVVTGLAMSIKIISKNRWSKNSLK